MIPILLFIFIFFFCQSSRRNINRFFYLFSFLLFLDLLCISRRHLDTSVSLDVFKIVLMIAIPCIFVLTLVSVYFVRKRTRDQKTWRYHSDPEGSLTSGDPLIQSQGSSIRDLIEHTSSGSGSGKYFLFAVFYAILLS